MLVSHITISSSILGRTFSTLMVKLSIKQSGYCSANLYIIDRQVRWAIIPSNQGGVCEVII